MKKKGTGKSNAPTQKDIYQQLLNRARISSEHFCIVKDPNQANGLSPTTNDGRATAKLLQSILDKRKFDPFCRPIKNDIDEVDTSTACRRFQPIQVKPAHRPLEEIRAEAARRVGEDYRQRRKKEMPTKPPSWKIGRKADTHGPPGLRPPIKGISNSLGNERYFEGYDGEWKDGNLEGEGTFTYTDSSSYEGQFRQNLPEGRGNSTYLGGKTKFQGEYRAGLPHGQGRCKYHDDKGITYQGDWKHGRRDGRGKLTYPNGSKYVGDFRRGQMHGEGTFTSAASGLVYSGSFCKGHVSKEGVLVYPDGKRVSKYWPSDVVDGNGLTISDAIEYMSKEDGASR